MNRKSKKTGKDDAAELVDQLSELRKEQLNLRMQKGSGQLTQTHHMKRVRRDIARVKTSMSAKK